MCLEKEQGRRVFFFPVTFGSCPNAPGVMTKLQRGTQVKRRHTLKTVRRARPVIIQSFESSSLMSHWFIPLSASPFQSPSGSLSVSVLCYLLVIRDCSSREWVDLRHPLVDGETSKSIRCETTVITTALNNRDFLIRAEAHWSITVILPVLGW